MPNLLLIDPDRVAAEMLVRRLQRHGYEVTVAADGAIGLELARAEPGPDVVLAELAVPSVDGWELARRLKADARTRRLPLLAVTVRALDQDRARALAAGFDDHDTKPVDLPRLLGKVEALLQRRATVRPPADAALPTRERLLVLDGNTEQPCQPLVDGFRERGYTVDVVTGIDQALQLLDKVAFQLALVDMRTRLETLDALSAIRETHSRSALPIVIVSVRSAPEDTIEALAAGANDYLSRPVAFQVLLARVGGLLKSTNQGSGRTETRRVRRIESGTTLEGRYELGAELGRGGSARVFAARQLSTGQQVAVKVLTTVDLEDGSSVTRSVSQFQREMAAIGQLRHPHIVRLIDSGMVEQVEGALGQRLHLRPYLVMELLDGQSLAERLKAGPFAVTPAIDLMLPVASALELAHAARIVHRDVKPANIFLTKAPGGRDHPIVLDFGIAKQLRGDGALAADGASLSEGGFVGTARYLAPEQADGHRISPSTDQYALASVILECMSGKSPFPREMAQIVILDRIARGEVPGPREQVPSLPEPLATVLERALSLDPAARHPSIAHLAWALLPFASVAAQAAWEADFRAAIGTASDRGSAL